MTSPPEITHCGRTVSGDFVAWDIRWEGGMPDGAVVQWSMVVADEDEEVRLIHGRRGSTTEQYVVGAGGREDVEPDADVSEHEITVRFPADLVGVAVEWPVWTAVVTVDGEDVSQMVCTVSS